MTAAAVAVSAAPDHEWLGHPERPERVAAAMEALAAFRVSHVLDYLSPASLADDLIDELHGAGYAASMAALSAAGPKIIDPAPTYVTRGSWAAAKLAAGAAVGVVDAVIDGAPWGMALVRPPGHHAEPGRAMGFCLAGNIALAARQACDRGLRRVMIVDLDVHHGNGTAALCCDDHRVLYVSLHREGIYPGTGSLLRGGDGIPPSNAINVPLPGGLSDDHFKLVLLRVVVPAAKQFRPDLVLVSLGLDGHWRDPLADWSLTGVGFHHALMVLVNIAKEYAGGRIAVVLEGGYDLVGITEGIDGAARALGGIPLPAVDGSYDDGAVAGHPDRARQGDAIEAIVAKVRTLHGL